MKIMEGYANQHRAMRTVSRMSYPKIERLFNCILQRSTISAYSALCRIDSLGLRTELKSRE